MNIEVLLRERGLTKSALSEMMGIKSQNFNKLMENPKLSSIEKIANALGVKVWELLKEEEDLESNSITCPKCGARFKLEE